MFDIPEPPAWWARAACRGENPRRNRWFADGDHPLEEARIVCRTCPVQVDCYLYAVDLHQSGWPVVGVWGGVRFRGKIRNSKAASVLKRYEPAT